MFTLNAYVDIQSEVWLLSNLFSHIDAFCALRCNLFDYGNQGK